MKKLIYYKIKNISGEISDQNAVVYTKRNTISIKEWQEFREDRCIQHHTKYAPIIINIMNIR